MSVEVSWDLLDHKWNNFAKWIENCEKRFGPDTKIPISSINKTMAMADKIEATTDEVIIKALFEPTKPEARKP